MFFDNASTTKIDEDIISSLGELNDKYFYNAGALYSEGRNVKKIIGGYRQSILEALNGVQKSNIIFTGSATEANNMAFFGTIRKNTKKILVSNGEHPSVYNTVLEFASKGFDVEFVGLDKSGKVDIDDFKSKLTPEVDFVSIMHVSNETGAINDIEYLVELVKEVNPKAIFHCDGVQAVGKIHVDLESLGVDMYTMSAHKIHGMKGVGALYVSPNVKLKPFVFGGGQEGGLRSGTENTLGIFTLSSAIQKVCDSIEDNFNYVSNLKKRFLDLLSQLGLNYALHSFDDNSPYILSISFLGCRAETLLNMLNDKGFCVGNGSACSSSKIGNRVLESMSISKAEIESNLRISFSKFNTIEEVESLVDAIKLCVKEYLNKVR